MTEQATTPTETPQPEKSRNFFLRFWRGEYSLGISYWAFGIGTQIAVLALCALIGFVGGTLGATDRQIRIAAVVLILATTVWICGGIFQAADNHIARTGRRFWANAAKVMLVIGVLESLSEFVKSGTH